MRLTLHWSSPNQVCNSATWGGNHSLPCTQDRPCVVKNYNRQEVGMLKRNTGDLEEQTLKKISESKVWTTMPKDSRSIWGGRLEAMNGELWAHGTPVLQSLTAASRALLQWILSSLATHGTAMKKQMPQLNPENKCKKQLVLMTGNGNNRSNKQQSTPTAEECYWTEETHNRPLIHSQSHQAQHLRVNQKQAWTKEETKEVIWCYMYCRQHFAGNYKKMYERWRQCNPDSRMYLDAKKLLNQKKLYYEA